jgi:hypothetical protein
MRPYYLDGDLTDFDHIPLRRCGLHRSGDTRYSAAAYRWRLMWLLCSFQGPWRGVYAGRCWVLAGALFARLPHHRRTPVSQNSTACWRCYRRLCPTPQVVRGVVRFAPIQPGSVDMLGPTARTPAGTFGLTRSPSPDGRCDRGTVVLPRKEVIQPQLPLRLPCSRGSPCRHGAWTISSSSLLDAKPRIEQTSLPRVPRTHARHKGFMARCQNIEPPEIWIYQAARVMNPTTIYAFRHEHRS